MMLPSKSIIEKHILKELLKTLNQYADLITLVITMLGIVLGIITGFFQKVMRWINDKPDYSIAILGASLPQSLSVEVINYGSKGLLLKEITASFQGNQLHFKRPLPIVLKPYDSLNLTLKNKSISGARDTKDVLEVTVSIEHSSKSYVKSYSWETLGGLIDNSSRYLSGAKLYTKE